MRTVQPLGELQFSPPLAAPTIEATRSYLAKAHAISARGGVFLLKPDQSNFQQELTALRLRHALVMGIMKQRIFLSHKSADKARVRDFKATLESLGFKPWLDEDDMPAGTALNRGILEGMKDSCAAVFFVTKDFKDEKWIGDEVDYAKAQKHADDRFAIITLVFEDAADAGAEANVPELFKIKYVYKKPRTDLEALREILRALPLQVSDVRLR